MDANQQNQQPSQAQNAMQPNMMQMPGQQRFPQGPGGQQGYPMGMPQQMNPAHQQQQFMQMQQMNAQGFFQGQPGQPRGPPQGGQPGQPQAPGGGQPGQQYRAKPGFQGGPPQQNQVRGQPMPGMLGGLPNAVLDQMNKPGFMQGGQNNNTSPGAKRPREPMYSLYIGNLADTVFELDLFKFFQAQGYKLRNARVMFDENSRSKRFGYLNFHDAEESERCLREMNNATLAGKQIVLNKQKNRDFDSSANLLVRNLPKTMDQKGLTDLFSKYGEIGSCKLEIFSTGESRCFGYVQFQKADNAQNAINALNNQEIEGSVISVLAHQKREERGPAQSEHYTNIFLQNLPTDFTADSIKQEFGKYGAIQSAELGSKPGHGFVNYKDHESAKQALDAVNMKLKLDGHQAILAAPHIYRKESDLQPKGSVTNPIVQNQKEMFKSNIFVNFVPKDVSKEELEQEFSKAGGICSTKLRPQYQKDRDSGQSFQTHQTAYILYDDVKAAQKSIRLFDQTRPFPGQNKMLKVDFWQAKEDLKLERDEKSQALIKQILNLCKSQTAKTQFGMPNPPMQPGPGMMGQHQQQMMGGPQGPGGQFQDGGQQHRPRYNNHQGDGGNRGGYNNQRGNNRGGNRGGNRGNYQGNNQRGGNRDNRDNRNQGGNRPQHGQPQGQQQMMQQPTGGAPMTKQPAQLRLPQVDISPLDGLQGEERDNFVGNNIYPAIFNAYGEEEAPTITGMILDESAVDYKELLTNSNYFQQKVTQAHAIFKKSQNEQQ